MTLINRRNFLARSSALGFAAGVGAISSTAVQHAAAADTSGYKALVCILLNGGMDQSDTVIPYDAASWTQLRTLRGGLFNAYRADQSSSSRNRANLLKLNPTNAGQFGGREFSMPPELARAHEMFESGDLAVIGNVGPLIEPITRQQYENGSARLPPRRGSHNDMKSLWLSMGLEGTRYGWGGRFADAAIASAPADDPTFAAVSTGSNFPFLAGETVRPFRIAKPEALEPDVISKGFLLSSNGPDVAIRNRLDQYLNRSDFGESNLYAADFSAAKAEAIGNSRLMLASRGSTAPMATVFPSEPLAQKMKLIAETIQIQSRLNTSRQIFYVSLGGFDTHGSQSATLPVLHANLSNALWAFKNAMLEINHWNNTTVFTTSDFGRAMIDNGDGTDHGWGGLHFVLGGGVQGKQIYGDIPVSDVNNQHHMPGRGSLIPSVSVEQYAATLGSWYGLTSGELATIFPNLSNFSRSNLGFV